jgi:uncharacterized damage-inducible protein DinB
MAGGAGTMTYDDVKTLFDYHYWARDRTLDALDALTPDEFTRDLGSSFRSIRDTMAHTYSAEWVWNQRWQGLTPKAMLPPEQFPDVASTRQQWLGLEQTVKALIADLGDEGMNRVLHYTLLSGLPVSSPFWQMFQHVVNHASYHRGQVTTMLRQIGAAPPKSCDMVTFYRERLP